MEGEWKENEKKKKKKGGEREREINKHLPTSHPVCYS
jgi:hypothetical protein